ncbi:unnamed protein product [Rotaria sp. Silwood2]|nr:unnamed protein product [Rotaria sp. Silwood2]CAF3087067.1 unnamed protein product [Rotaria sp. Silwood2]CAF4224871.1 unnamed protein product [Rotaria sp. Silwood2]CAF4419862.1 unnamed protein product [Rotaria sp. Silwood2]
MGGGALSAVASAAGFGLKQHEYNQFQNRMSWITNVGTIEELTDVARQVARKLADRYEDQLLSLRPRSDEVSQVCLCCCAPSAPSTKDDSSAKKTPTKAMGPAEQVASFGVAAALQIIVDGTCTKLELAKYKEPEYLADTLTEMSNTDQERNTQRARRSRAQSANLNEHFQYDDKFDSHRYSRLLEKRLRAADLLEREDRPIVAMQRRHVNNRQHTIPFRQQFIEQIVHDFQEIDRKLEMDYRKQAEKKDQQTARLLRQLETVYQKQLRDLNLYNNRTLIRELMEEHLQKSTPQGQLRRIHQLEEELRQLKINHDTLVRRVDQNETNCNQNKHNQDEEIDSIKQKFEQYRIEIEQYRKNIDKTIIDLQTKLETLLKKQEILDKKQEEHGVSILNLSLQRDTLTKLSQDIELIINNRRSDLDTLNKFIKKLNGIKNSLNQVRERFHLLDRIPLLEQEIEKIRDLITGHDKTLKECNLRIDSLSSSLQNLERRVNDIKNTDITMILQRLSSIEDDLKRKSQDIANANNTAKTALDEVNGLRETVEELKKKLSYLNERISVVEDILKRLDELEMKFKDLDIDEIRKLFLKLTEMEKQLDELTKELNNLKDIVKGLNTNSRTNSSIEGTLEAYMNDVKKQISESLSSLSQQLLALINEAKQLISILDTKLNELLTMQQQIPSKEEPIMLSSSNRILYVEPLKSIDLLQDIWT